MSKVNNIIKTRFLEVSLVQVRSMSILCDP